MPAQMVSAIPNLTWGTVLMARLIVVSAIHPISLMEINLTGKEPVAALEYLLTGSLTLFSSSVNSRIVSVVPAGTISGSSQLTSSFDTRYAISASFVSSSNVLSMRTITSASYAALTPVSGTLYIIIG